MFEKEVKNSIISIPSNNGFRYALITGDWGLHHLWSFTSKLVGFKKPIAHGMWSLERCINEIKNNLYKNDINFINNIANSDIICVDCSFKTPCYVPGKALLRVVDNIDSNQCRYKFGMSSMDTNTPYIIGMIYGIKDQV